VSGTKGWSTTKTQTIGPSTTISLNRTFTSSYQGTGEGTSFGVTETISLSGATVATESSSQTDERNFTVSVSNHVSTLTFQEFSLIRLKSMSIGVQKFGTPIRQLREAILEAE
jgi:hypothetical protein